MLSLHHCAPRRWPSAGVLLAAWIALGASASAVSLEVFRGWKPAPPPPGTNTWHHGISVLPPSKPLLVILAEFTGVDVSHTNNLPSILTPGYQYTHTNGLLYGTNSQFYENLVFSQGSQSHTVNGYFHEMSNGRFSWTKAGVVKLSLPASSLRSNCGGCDIAPLIVQRVAQDALFDFNTCVDYRDGYGRGHITNLTILILCNDPLFSASTSLGSQTASWPLGVPLAGTNYFGGPLSRVHDHDNLATHAHELSHALGVEPDLYYLGAWGNGRFALMSVTVITDPPLNMEVWHHDAWTKLQLGWTDPRIIEIPQPGGHGFVTLPAAQMGDPGAPAILCASNYARGDEYFILEYRTTNSPAGAGYDANVLGYIAETMVSGGLVIWHVFPKAQWSWNQQPTWTECPPEDPAYPGFETQGRRPWSSGSTTPVLTHWSDNSSTQVNLHVLPFSPGAGSITVEWSMDETWVSFAYEGSYELGNWQYPFKSLAGGATAVRSGGTVHLKARHSPETIRIGKPMRLQAEGGAAIIGR